VSSIARLRQRVCGTTVSALAVAVRIARRDALRNRGRSVLIMVLIALPVLAGVALDVLARSSSPSPVQQVRSELAGADAWVTGHQGGAIRQGFADATFEPVASSPDGTPLPVLPVGDILPLLPAGSQITLWRHASVPLLGADGRYRSVTADLLDITSPAAGDRYRVTAGAGPATPDQVALTDGLAAQLGLHLGDTVTAGAPARHYTLVGLLASNVPGDQDQGAIVALPHAVAMLDVWDPDRYLVASRCPSPGRWCSS
jgi:putative ABC transport system permease protein